MTDSKTQNLAPRKLVSRVKASMKLEPKNYFMDDDSFEDTEATSHISDSVSSSLASHVPANTPSEDCEHTLY